MRKVLGCVVLVVALSCGAFGEFVADGDLSEWGVTPGTDWHNDLSAAEWLEPEVGPDGYVGPGWGGQQFNVEAVYATADCRYLYYAIVTGFPGQDTCASGNKHKAGDILFDIEPLYNPSDDDTPTGAIEFAVETTTHDSNHTHGGKAGQNQGAGSFYSNVTPGLATEKWDGVYYPVEIKRTGSEKLAQGTLVGQTDFAYNDDFYGSDHYVIEGIIPLSYFGDIGGQSGTMLWTMTCANDYGFVEGEFPICELPEPGTLFMLGSGSIFGLGYYLRRRMS